MNLTVWKFRIPMDEEFCLEIPSDPDILHVDVQHGDPCLWARVDPDRPFAKYTFYIVGTGHDIPPGLAHVGTWQEGPFVWHLFR